MTKGVSTRLQALDRLLKSERPRSAIETLCIQRQITDLQRIGQNGLKWNEDEAQRAVNLCGLLKHWKGEWAGRPFELEPWQEHLIIAPLFGWYRAGEDSVRRYNSGLGCIPRKNGKTTTCAPIAVQGIVADREQGAEVYAAATKRDQACIVFDDVKNMLRQSPYLLPQVKIWKHSITCDRLNSSFKPLSSDHNSLHGLNLHRGIVDELHSHKERHLWDVLLTATGARRNPLLFGITTAGFDRSTICWELYQWAEQVLEGTVEDDSFFAFITCAEPEDDPFDPQTHWKANPNYNISIKSEYLNQEANKAKNSPAYENTFRRLHLNQWTEQDVRWLPMHAWDECVGSVDADELAGRPCYAALDLASTRDVNAFVLVFPGVKHKILPFFWIPSEAKDERGQFDRRPVMNYASQGLIKTMPGNTSDYPTIVEDIVQLTKKYDVREICYDPWGPANAITQMLQAEGFPLSKLVEFRQTIGNFAAPTKEFERLLLARKLEHGGNPVLRWMASNVTVTENANGDYRPDKGKSADKIDGIVAAIMGLARAMMTRETTSIYETPGNMTL